MSIEWYFGYGVNPEDKDKPSLIPKKEDIPSDGTTISIDIDDGQEYINIPYKIAKMCDVLVIRVAKKEKSENIIINVSDIKYKNEKINRESLKGIITYLKIYENPPPPFIIPAPLKSNNLSDHDDDPRGVNFIDNYPMTTNDLINLINSSYFLKCKPLTFLTTAKMASLTKGKTMDEIIELLKPDYVINPEK